MNPNLKLLKTISDGWREEWKLRVHELAIIKEGVRGAKERWKLAEKEYKEAKNNNKKNE